MLSLWYIILGWKEYNKPLIKQERPEDKVKKPAADPPKKPDLIPQKSPSQGGDGRKPEAPKPTAPSGPQMPSMPKDIPKAPDNHKLPELPELPKGPPKIPERPRVPDPPKVPDIVKGSPKGANSPKTPEPPKNPPKIPDFPKPGVKGPDSPKIRESGKAKPKTPSPPKSADSPNSSKVSEKSDMRGGMMPSKRPDSAMPTFPDSGKNPVSGPSQDFPLPPYLPGTPSGPKPPLKGDELFDLGKNLKDSNETHKPFGDLRDLSYGKGELPEEVSNSPEAKKAQQYVFKASKYMEDSTVPDPDSLASTEEEEEEEED